MLCFGKIFLVVNSPVCCLLAVVGNPAELLPVLPDMPQLVSQLLFPGQVPFPLIPESGVLGLVFPLVCRFHQSFPQGGCFLDL